MRLEKLNSADGAAVSNVHVCLAFTKAHQRDGVALLGLSQDFRDDGLLDGHLALFQFGLNRIVQSAAVKGSVVLCAYRLLAPKAWLVPPRL
jgi:hypothetical protein